MALPWNISQQVLRWGGTFGPEMAGFIEDNFDYLYTNIGPGAGVTSFNTRTGVVTLFASDVMGVIGPLTANSVVIGAGTAAPSVVASLGAAGEVLTSQGAGLPPIWAAGGGGGGGVTSFNTRTGAVTLLLADVTGALTYTPVNPAAAALTGTPTSPTAAPGTNTTQIASTAFVQAAVAAATAGVASFNTRTGIVTLLNTDVSGAGGLLLANNLSDVASAATSRTNLGLAIGTNVQAYNAILAALAGVTGAADKVPYFTGASAMSVADFTALGRAIVALSTLTSNAVLVGSGSGAPAALGSLGSTGQILTSNGAGSPPSWQTGGGGGTTVRLAVIQDQKASGTVGQTLTAGTWSTRNLQTEVFDPDGIVSISSNQFSLGAGTYMLTAVGSVFSISNISVRSRLFNITDSTVVGWGSPGRLGDTATGGAIEHDTTVNAAITIVSAKTFAFQTYADDPSPSTVTTGTATSIASTVEVYSTVTIQKVA